MEQVSQGAITCEMAAERDRSRCQGAAGVGHGGRQCQAHTCAKGQLPSSPEPGSDCPGSQQEARGAGGSRTV